MGFAIAAGAARRVPGDARRGPTAVSRRRSRSCAFEAPPTCTRRHGARRSHASSSWRRPWPTTPGAARGQKVTKRDDTLTLVLTKTPTSGRAGRRRLRPATDPARRFAAETERVARATANASRNTSISLSPTTSGPDAGFDVDANAVTSWPDGAESIPLQSKARIAATILSRGRPRPARNRQR